MREDLSSQVNDSIEQGKTVARKVSRRARELGDQAQEHIRRVGRRCRKRTGVN